MEARILAMARETPVETLCDIWGTTAADANAARNGKRPLMFIEVGALCRVNGVRMSDVLRGPILN